MLTHGFRLPTRALGHATLLAGAAVWSWLAAGCASVPDASFLKSAYSAQSAQFKNAWGPIPAKGSAAIMAELKRKSGDLDILERQAVLEQVLVGEPLAIGNRATLLLDGPATYQAMFAAARAAKRNINIESYIIEDGEVGQKFAELLIERRAAGVEINILYDSVGAIKTSKEFFEKLRQGGIRVIEFNPVNPLAGKILSLNHRDHRKLFIVDGRTVILGGINIDDVYSTGSGSRSGGSSGGSGGSGKAKGGEKRSGWRDTDIQIDGPVVADFQKMFLETWQKQKGPPLAEKDYLPIVPALGKEIVRAIGSSPDDKLNALYLSFLAAITNAQKQVFITNAYFVPDPQLVEALVAAAQRGVDVRLILPSTTDSRSAAHAAHSHYTELLKGGVKIYERRAALLHAKTAVVDGVWSCVGSANLDWRSAVANDEVAAVILSRDFGEHMLKAYALDQAQSDAILLEQWRHRSMCDRAKETFFRLFGRLL